MKLLRHGVSSEKRSTKTVKDVVTDFLGSEPSLDEIAGYRLPHELQERAHALLKNNRTGSLRDDERSEMEGFRETDHLLTRVKAKANLKLTAQSSWVALKFSPRFAVKSSSAFGAHFVISTSRDKDLKVWEAATGRCCATAARGHRVASTSSRAVTADTSTGCGGWNKEKHT